MNTRRFKFISIAFLVIVSMAFGIARRAAADHDIGVFELDRNAQDSPTVIGDDWDTLQAGGGSANAFTGILPDIGADGGTQFQGGGSKDNNNITQWLWQPGEPLDKDDITNAYAAAYVGGPDNHLYVYYGLDRFANNGSAQVGFWFLQDPNFGLTNIASQGGFKFSGAHQLGDLLIQSNFTQGGVISNISIFKWVGSGGSNGALDLVFNAKDCIGQAGAGDPACATVNQSNTPSPWPYTPKFGTAGTFPAGSFFEGGVDITELVPDAGCFTGFLAETRSSTPFDSRLKDFVLGNFDLCSISVTKSGDSLSKVGDDVNYTVTIKNTGSLPLYKDDISDTLLGSITVNGVDQANASVQSNSCGATLAVGATCTITLKHTVQASDADPLPNTVSVVYRGKTDLSGSAVSGSADHSVNLFQPSITFDKSASIHLSKVGDAVTYTLTLNNTSSSDTPDLVCTVSDPTLGISKSVTLSSGGSDVTTKSYTFKDGDPDSYTNTASVSCSPTGFPNVLTKSDSESVNLFQPSITFDKSVSAHLSKVGDSVLYTLTLNNTSSSDTPDLVCTVSDPTLGVNKSVTLASGGSDVTTKSYTFQAGDADPFTNTASVSCSPTGFPNVLTKSDSESVNLFQPSITFDKSVSAHLSKVGDSVNYTVSLNNTSSSDTPDLVCTISDPTLGVNKSVTLASGGSDVTAKSYTFKDGDPDPYTNTASVSCSPTGFSNVLTKSDSESVNLFQPAIAAAKTGDDLSKVGDDVNYTITLSNNSSSDTPALNCTASDSLLGSVFSGVLPLGDTVIHKTRTVQQGDSDPLVNTVNVSCGVAGFSNVLTGSASHSTNLFQPGVEVLKSGPDTGAVGQSVTYSFTINNLSSSDGPDLKLASVLDTVIGDITSQASAGGCDTLAAGASCSFTADYTIQAGDPNPLVNVVTVLYHPEGFPNNITDDDSHSLTIPSQGCTPGFWQGGAGADLWDGVNDPAWVPFIHTTLFNDFFNSPPTPALAGKTMFDLVSGGGGSVWVEKAARDMVAAYLNESAFPAGYAATSLADLTNMWYAAVAGGDPALQAFHDLVSGWNAETATQICPLP